MSKAQSAGGGTWVRDFETQKIRKPHAILKVPDFDLQLTLESGQVFHTEQEGDLWKILFGSHLLAVRQIGEHLEIFSGSEAEVGCYFALDHPMSAIHASFPKDAYSQAALSRGRGMRILRQPAWECLATFITSSMKQVAHIRQMSLAIRSRFGTPVLGSAVSAYPDPSRLAGLAEQSLRDCGLGFRAKNLIGTARAVDAGIADLEAWRALPTDDLREKLCTLPGVGRKVANCVLLFAYERLEAVPVDVWIARIATAMRKRKSSPLKLEEFSVRRFGPYAGYVQQYLFHHARTTGKLPGQ
ncbi:MAG: DNA glycosylase [Terrimicrobiaceae bacterium]